jgi:hypothetical protein
MTDRPTLKCASENEALKLEDRDESIKRWVSKIFLSAPTGWRATERSPVS